MKRWLFTIVSALSLLLCMGFILLYVCGLNSVWTMGHAAPGRYYALTTASHKHSLYLVAFHDPMVVGSGWIVRRDPPGSIPPTPPAPDGMTYAAIALPGYGGFGCTQRIQAQPLFDYAAFNAVANVGATEHVVQLWPVPYILATMLLPVWYALRWVNVKRQIRQRIAAGLCPACGYDLRASKERCPECGTAIPAHAASNGGKV